MAEQDIKIAEDPLAPTGVSGGTPAKQAVPAPSNDKAEQKPERPYDKRDELLDPDYAEAIFEFYETRNELLKDTPFETVRKAWFATSHLLLPDQALVADMGCGDGILTYCMAALNPQLRFVGYDKSKRDINKARELYQLHNLEFKVGDVTKNAAKPNSLDAIVNSGILHEVYSGSRYNERIVSDTLEQQFEWLKVGGTMFIRDYSRPPPEEFVLLELKDKTSHGDTLQAMSEVDLLIWYSEHARPRQDPGCGGFFLEELPPKRPYTRLFRLPFKWAYEFIMRKDEREKWEKELPVEYTVFTPREFRRELSSLGARVLYTAPQWDEKFIEDNFHGSFNLYRENGEKVDTPPTGFIAVAQKMPERKSLNIFERRPAQEERDPRLSIFAMRNEVNGQLVDVVTPQVSCDEIIPYRITEEGRLKVYLHDGMARAITNSVLRKGSNIDGKRWSGHMVEPIAVDNMILGARDEPMDNKSTILFARDHLGVKPAQGEVLIDGPDYYPSPDYIDERIQTRYLHVNQASGEITPKSTGGHVGNFLAKGKIREFDAQQVLNGITVGMVPHSRLELQILSLYNHLKLRAETWTNKEVAAKDAIIGGKLCLANIIRQMSQTDHRFREVKGTTGQLRRMQSIFVEEGRASQTTRGLTANDLDFVISDEKSTNVAVVLPMTKNMKEEIHAGFTVSHLPVPQRHRGNGLTLSVPAFEIPAHLTDMQDIKRFVGEKFGVPEICVFKLGESFYSHIGLTPQRVYPFAVTAPHRMFINMNSDCMFMPMSELDMAPHFAKSQHFLTVMGRAWKMMGEDIRLESKRQVRMIMDERLPGQLPEWSVPTSYQSPPGILEVETAGMPADYALSQPDQNMQTQPAPAPAPTIDAIAASAPESVTEAAISPDLDAQIEQGVQETVEAETEQAEPGPAPKAEQDKPRPEKW